MNCKQNGNELQAKQKRIASKTETKNKHSKNELGVTSFWGCYA